MVSIKKKKKKPTIEDSRNVPVLFSFYVNILQSESAVEELFLSNWQVDKTLKSYSN